MEKNIFDNKINIFDSGQKFVLDLVSLFSRRHDNYEI
jgi:hypothetical protein